MTDDTSDTTDDRIDRRMFLHMTGAVGGALGLAGCSTEPGGTDTPGGDTPGGADTPTPTPTVAPDEIQEGGTLVWGHSEVTQRLDVHLVQTAASNRFLSNIHAPLVGLSDELEVTAEPDVQAPGLAEDWSISDDRLTYEFTLREGVRFHDGSTLTSADVQYSFERIQNPDVGALYQGIISKIEGIETPDDRTVVLNLGEVYQPMLRQLAFLGTAIIPEGSGDQQDEEPVGAGPFRFVSRQQGNRAVMEAFDDYWGDGPYLDEVEERTVTDPDGRLTGVQEGTYDFTNDLPLDDMNDLVGNTDDSLKTETWTPLAYAFLNFNLDRPPFDDRDFREGFVYALDKEQLVEGALFGNGQAIETPSFPNSPFRNDDLEPRGPDVEQAQQLIEGSDYAADEFTLQFKVTNNYPWHVDAATIMQQQLQQAGVPVEIQQLQWSDWLSQVIGNRDYRLAMVNWFSGWEPAYMYRSIWHSEGAFNWLGYASDEFDAAIENADTAGSRQEAIEQYRRAQEVLHEDLPSPFLWFRDGAMAADQSVQALDTVLHPNNSYVNFGRVWLQD